MIKDKIFYDADRAVKDVTLSMLEPCDSACFLDCGPGNCLFTEELADRLGVRRVYVVDNRVNRLNLASNRGYTCEMCDFNREIGYPDNHFDAVHAGQIIEHLNDTDRFVKELYRVTKPRGYLVISTPNLSSWHTVLWLLLGKQPHVAMVSDEIVRWRLDDGEVDEPKHRRLFTGEGLAMLLEHHGFKVEAIRGAGYYPFVGRPSRLMGILDRRHAAYVVIKARKEVRIGKQ